MGHYTPPPKVVITERHLQVAESVVDRARAEVDMLEKLLLRPGRTKEWSVRGILILFILLARWGPRGFRLIDVFDRLELPDGAWERLGLSKPNGKPITYRQVRYAFECIGAFMDPFARDISDDEHVARQSFAEQLSTRLLVATMPREVRRRFGKYLAIDGTLMWSFAKPTDSATDKVMGVRLDNSPQGFDNSVSNDDFLSADESSIPQLAANCAVEEKVELTKSGKRKRTAPGASWVGRTNRSKGVHGYAHHVTTLTPGPHDEDTPLVAVGLVTTPAPTNAMKVGLEHAPFLFDELPKHGLQPVRELSSDAAYSASSTWFNTILAHNVDPVSRLHGQNQEGLHGTLANGEILLIDSRPHCKCCPSELHGLIYPYKNWEQDNFVLMAPYLEGLRRRTEFELTMRGTQPYRGAYTFNTPHFDTHCPRCEHLPETERCCRQKSHRIRPESLPALQLKRFGDPDWQASYSARSRIESYFSQLKSADIMNFTRLWAKFTDFGKIALATLFAAIAASTHALEKFLDRDEKRRQGDDDGRKPRKVRPGLETYLPQITRPTPDIAVAANSGRPPPPVSMRPSARKHQR